MLHFFPDDSWSCGQDNVNYLSWQPKDLPVVDYLQNSFPQLHLSLTHMPFLPPGLEGWESIPLSLKPDWPHDTLWPKQCSQSDIMWFLGLHLKRFSWFSFCLLGIQLPCEEAWATSLNDDRPWRDRKRESISPLLFHLPHLKLSGTWIRPSCFLHLQLRGPQGTETSQALANLQRCEQLSSCGYFKPLTCGVVCYIAMINKTDEGTEA